ncbi:MAG: hypothetical protein LBT98_02530 [Puniceicoccales bacterium]|nr:hypothetical protein [Puniceicoccales bacterium]
MPSFSRTGSRKARRSEKKFRKTEKKLDKPSLRDSLAQEFYDGAFHEFS